eukprot:UN03351
MWMCFIRRLSEFYCFFMKRYFVNLYNNQQHHDQVNNKVNIIFQMLSIFVNIGFIVV